MNTAGPAGGPLDRRFPQGLTLTEMESSPGAGDHLTAAVVVSYAAGAMVAPPRCGSRMPRWRACMGRGVELIAGR